MSATPAHRVAIEAHTQLLYENKALKSQLRHLQAQVDKLEEEKRRLLTRQYGPSSEKDPTAQMRLFNEPEAIE